MSFILDALRKSEHERRMETAPDIMHAPAAVARQSLPAWSIVLIAALAAALIAVSALSWWQRPTSTITEAADVPAPAAPLPVAAPPQVSLPAPTAVQPSTAANVAEAAPVLPAEVAREEVTAVQAASTAAAAPAPAAEPPASETDLTQLPVYPAIAAEGISVGTLQMQLHVHSGVTTNRFVVINGVRQREGDTMSEGLLVEEIVPEGAVLSYQGRRFLLTAN